MRRTEQRATHRIAIEKLDTGDVAEHLVPHDVAGVVRELAAYAEAPDAVMRAKLRWAMDLLAVAAEGARDYQAHTSRVAIEEGWTDWLRREQSHAARTAATMDWVRDRLEAISDAVDDEANQ